MPGLANPWVGLSTRPPYVAGVDLRHLTDEFQQRYDLQLAAMPLPFVGNPLKASVVLLQTNPSFDPQDIVDQDTVPGYLEALRLNLTRPDDFMLLRPEFASTCAAGWWRPHLAQLIRDAGLDNLLRNLVVVEYFPYHSPYDNHPPSVPSQRYTFELVREVLDGPALIVVMRAWGQWTNAVPELVTRERVYRASNWQRAYVTPGNLKGGAYKLVVEALGGGGVDAG